MFVFANSVTRYKKRSQVIHCALFESCQRDDVISLRKGSGEGGGASGAAKYTEFQVCFNFHNKLPVELEQQELTERNFTKLLWGFYTIKL